MLEPFSICTAWPSMVTSIICAPSRNTGGLAPTDRDRANRELQLARVPDRLQALSVGHYRRQMVQGRGPVLQVVPPGGRQPGQGLPFAHGRSARRVQRQEM